VPIRISRTTLHDAVRRVYISNVSDTLHISVSVSTVINCVLVSSVPHLTLS